MLVPQEMILSIIGCCKLPYIAEEFGASTLEFFLLAVITILNLDSLEAIEER
jgi:hypothetical protein